MATAFQTSNAPGVSLNNGAYDAASLGLPQLTYGLTSGLGNALGSNAVSPTSTTPDASEQGCGVTLIKINQEKDTCVQLLTAKEQESHINHLEAKASALAVQQILHLIPSGAHLTIQTDASSTAWAWNKCSSKGDM